tara:strand:- start:176791 stop:177243 length:453 start_codon:yes stop_codon:yes gene_type:complete
MGIKAQSRLIKGAPDYEEGLWTPTLGVMSGTDGVHTYDTQVGEYVRLGKLVWVKCTVDLGSFDGSMSGSAVVKGLPFVNTPGGTPFAISTIQNVTLNTGAGYSMYVALVRSSQSDIALREVGSDLNESALTQADFSSASAMVISGVYATP